MSKDSNDCELMNELFDNGEPIHWHPVAKKEEEKEKNNEQPQRNLEKISLTRKIRGF